MKITFNYQNNNSQKSQKQNLAFEAGLTPRMMQEIQQSDVLAISNKLEAKGILNDFKDNKILAWCCNKTVEIFEQINQKFGTNLSLPRGIFVEDFKYLNTETPHAYGICNLTRTTLIKGSGEIIPSRIVFFNSEHDWNDIDSIADKRYAGKKTGTDFFLYSILHEFTHVLHEDNLLGQFDGKIVLKKILSATNSRKVKKYQRKYGDRVSQLGTNALIDPLEAVGCDMPIKIIASLDKETLLPTKNPFIGTAYEKKASTKKYPDKKRPLEEILRNFWNGKFE